MGSRKFLEIVVGRMTRYSKEIKLVVKHLPTRATRVAYMRLGGNNIEPHCILYHYLFISTE